eukprot:Nk52_evm64s914 gene=Nk52_evmTU64s914
MIPQSQQRVSAASAMLEAEIDAINKTRDEAKRKSSIAHLEQMKEDKILHIVPDKEENIHEETEEERLEGIRNSPSVWSRDYFGLLCSYFITGIFYGLSSIIYPIVVVVYHQDRATVTSAMSIISICWSFKLFFGFVTDFYPICGYRRKPYIIVGYTGTVAIMFILSGCAEQISLTTFLFMLTLSNFFSVFADVASDGLTCQLAQTEHHSIRGRLQTTVYMVRTTASIITGLIGAFGLNGPSYNGNFDFELSLNWYCGILAVCGLIPLPGIIFMLKDAKAEEQKESFKNHLRDLRDTMLRRPIYQLVGYMLVANTLLGIQNNAMQNSLHIWVGISNMQSNLNIIFGNFMLILGMWLVKRYFLNTNWRILIIWCVTLLVVLQSFYYLFIWDITRNGWIYIFANSTSTLVQGSQLVVTTFFIVEIAEPGKEALAYALVTTAGNLVIPFSQVLSNNIGKIFPLSDADLARDDTEVRANFCYLQVLVNALNVLSLVMLVIYPSQKAAARELRDKYASKPLGYAIMATALVFLVYGTLVTVLTVIPSTRDIPLTGA